MIRAIRLASLVAVAILVSASGAFAQTTVTTNGTSGNWSNTGTWSPGVVPNNGSGNTYAVQILNTPNPVNVTLDTNITVNSLLLQSGTVLSTTSAGALTLGSLDNDGDMEFVNGNALTVNGATTIEPSGQLTLAGGANAIFNGNVINGANFLTQEAGNGPNTVTVNGSFTNNGTLAMTGSGDTLTVTGAFGNNGVLTIAGTGEVVNLGSLDNTTGTLTVLSGTTLNLTGGGSGITDIGSSSSVTIGGTFNLINGQTTTSALANLSSVEGTLSLGNGQVTNVTPGGGTLTFAAGSSVSIDNSSTLTVNGNLTNDGVVTTGAHIGGDNTLNVTGTFTNNGTFTMFNTSGGDPLDVGSLNNTGSLTIGAGTLVLISDGVGITDIEAGSSLDVAGDLRLSGGGSGLSNLTTIEGALTLRNGETAAITPMGGTLSISPAGTWNIAGTGTMVNLNGSISNSGAVTVIGNGTGLNLTGGLTNSGTVTVEQGNTIGVTGAFQTSGTTTVGGTLTAASFSQTGGTTTISGGVLTAPTVQVSGGAFQGNGTVNGNLTLNGGTLLAGFPNAPDTLTLNGNFTEGSGGTLMVDISGAPAGEYSVFNISGPASLGGTVDFVFLNGFAPTIGDEFTFLTFGSVSGNFASIVGFTCPAGAVCEDVFTANSLTLEILAQPPTNTPEPASVALLGSGMVACFAARRRKRRA
jgi:fibronectin-binding autotransporter adhesin